MKKFENFENSDISWNVDNIKDLIKYFEDRITELEEEQETSHFPEGEEEQLNRCEECKDLLRGMIDKRSWYYKNFNK